jgi:WhiB family redox-sensing transcriptional regulator
MTRITLRDTRTPARGDDWRDAAACAGAGEDMFPGTHKDDIATAKAYCHRCPVIEACLEWALDTGESVGVWGGLTEHERGAMRRRAARAISIDDYTGTRPQRQRALTLDEAWDAYTRVDGDHILWTGPKVLNLPNSKTQTTPNRVSFHRDRGRWPEGDTKRTCQTQGCVHPGHLNDRLERDRNPPGADTFQAVLDANTSPWPGGHVVWTGLRRASVQGREFTPKQLAFIADRGRAAQGSVRSGCAVPGCVLAAHLSDQAERGTCGAPAARELVS